MSARGGDQGPALGPIIEALSHPQVAPALAKPGDVGPEAGNDEAPLFPPGCPVRPLGQMSDVAGQQRCFYLDYNRQLVGLEANNRHGKLGLAALFGPHVTWLEVHFPQMSAPKVDKKTGEVLVPSKITGFDQARAAQALVVECARKGIFDPAGRMRGRGAHKLPGAGEGMVLHCGDKLLVPVHRASGSVKSWTYIDAGLHDGFVYPGASPVPRPWHERLDGEPAAKLAALLRTWQWKRPQLDPRFMLGWIGCAMVGGALDWRPNIWLTGGAGTGKSTLNGRNGVLHQIFGEGLFRTGNASAAAIRQSLRNSTVPVLFDELEAGTNNSRAIEVVELARVSSSGDNMHRGGQDHTAHEFTLASCFQFSSISIPPLEPQDRSRLGILELRPFPVGAIAPDLAKFKLAELGRQLQRRMIDGWERLEPTRAKYHRALAQVGHGSRACAQFSALLAGADVLLEDHETIDGEPSDEFVAGWAALCRPEKMAEISEATPDEVACIIHLTTAMVQAKGGDEREPLGNWIARAVDLARMVAGVDLAAMDKAQERLQNLGLKLVNARWNPDAHGDGGRWGAQAYQAHYPGFLAVANDHQGLRGLFTGTKWQGGVWRQTLTRHAGAIDGITVAIGKGIKSRAVLVPLWLVLGEEELPEASREAAHKAHFAKLTAQSKGAGA